MFAQKRAVLVISSLSVPHLFHMLSSISVCCFPRMQEPASLAGLSVGQVQPSVSLLLSVSSPQRVATLLADHPELLKVPLQVCS